MEDNTIGNGLVDVELSETTLMPSKLKFKEQGIVLNIKTEIIRYISSNSESGTYIFAPAFLGKPLKL